MDKVWKALKRAIYTYIYVGPLFLSVCCRSRRKGSQPRIDPGCRRRDLRQGLPGTLPGPSEPQCIS